MATERITIVVQERGTRVVNRRLRRTADAANVAQRAFQLMRRALVLFASVVLLRRLFQLVDAFTQLSNRLRIVTDTFGELRQVTESVLAISNRTRTAFDANAEVFTRVALSAKELGASQGEILQFLEALNQSIIISGASAQEASAGIIQLTQGLASNRLSGDELRSVLEQLPRAAQVIADSLDVGRGKLRELGEEGRLTGEVVFEAFLKAREELEDEFSEVVPTIGQSFTVLRNQIIATIGDVNRLIPLADGLAQTILLLARSLRALAFGAVVAGVIALAANFQLVLVRTQSLIRVLDILVLRSLSRLRKSLIANNLTMKQNVALSLRYQKVGLLPLTTVFAKLISTVRATNKVLQANILTTAGLATVYNGAAAAVTRLSAAFGLLRKAAASAGAAALANPYVLIAAAIAGAIALLVKFRDQIQINTGGLATLGDLGKAAFDNINNSIETIQTTLEDLFGFTLPSLEDIFDFIGAAIRETLLFIGVASDAIIGTVVGIYDGVVATFGAIPRVIGDLFFQGINLIIGGFEDLVNTITSLVSLIGETLRGPIEFLINLFVIGFNAVGNGIAGAINFIIGGINEVIDGAVSGINVLIEGVNALAEFLGQEGFDKLEGLDVGEIDFNEIAAITLDPGDLTIDPVSLDRVTNPFEGAGVDAAQAFGEAFSEALDEWISPETGATAAVLALLQQAEQNALDRIAQAREAELLAIEQTFQDQFDQLNAEIGLLRLTSEEREYQNRLNEIKNELIEEGINLEGDYEQQLLAQIEARLRQLQVVEAVSAALDEIRGVNIDLIAVEQELNEQLELGLITVEQKTRAYNLLANAVAEANVTEASLRGEVTADLENEIRLLRFSTSEREARTEANRAAAQVADDLAAAGFINVEAIREETAAIEEQLAPQFQRLETLREITNVLDEVSTKSVDLGLVQSELQDRIDEGTISVDEATAAYRKFQIAQLQSERSVASSLEAGVLQYADELPTVFEGLEQAVTGAFKGMEDAIVQFVTTGEFNFRNFANAIIADLARIAAQQAILGLISAFIPGGGFAAAAGGAAAGARALGGPVTGGQPYLVGERGPELFVPPTAGGSIEPNQGGQGGGNVRIINVVDPAAMSEYLASPEGERVILNTISKNPSTVRQAAGG